MLFLRKLIQFIYRDFYEKMKTNKKHLFIFTTLALTDLDSFNSYSIKLRFYQSNNYSLMQDIPNLRKKLDDNSLINLVPLKTHSKVFFKKWRKLKKIWCCHV